eukprot:1195184-Prorocentrum_minimum.AAC.6
MYVREYNKRVPGRFGLLLLSLRLLALLPPPPGPFRGIALIGGYWSVSVMTSTTLLHIYGVCAVENVSDEPVMHARPSGRINPLRQKQA